MGKKHPLDIFRTTAGGFDSATRDRRTLQGKVVASTPRPASARGDDGENSPTPGRIAAERGAPLIMAARAAAAARAQERFDASRARSSAASAEAPPRAPARAAARPANARSAPARASGPGAINRILLISALVIVGVFAVYLVGVNSSGTALKAPAAAGGSFAIAAATWDGSAAGKAAAEACRDALRAGGFPEVRVLGYPSAKAGEFRSFDLLVGSATSRDELATLLSQVGALRNSKGEVAFQGARVVPAPAVAAR